MDEFEKAFDLIEDKVDEEAKDIALEDTDEEIEEAAEDLKEAAKSDEEAAEETAEVAKTYAYKVMGNQKQLKAEAVEALAAELGIEPDMLVANLQKGEDYDRKTKRYDEQKPLVKALETFANQRGISVAEAAQQMQMISDRLDQVQKATELKRIADMAKLQNPNLDDASARQLAELQFENNRLKHEREKKDNDQKREEDLRKPLSDFFKAHPEFLQGDLPERFRELYQDGKSPNEALAIMQAEEARAELEALKKQNAVDTKAKQAMEKSPGSMVADVGEKAIDPFVAGFDEAYR